MYVSRENEFKNMAFWKSVVGDFLSFLYHFSYLLKMYKDGSKKEEDPDPFGLGEWTEFVSEESGSHNTDDYDPVAKAAKEGLLKGFEKEEEEGK